MQSNSEATSRFGYKSSIGQKDTRMKGKENSLTAPCLQPDAEKLVPKGTPKSRLPILAKAKEPPDFQKLHEAWENQFQKGKAVKKRTCTRPQPFNFSQKADRSRLTVNTEQSVVPQARRREPLAEVTLGQKNEEESKDRKGGSEEFQADAAALASILSNVGVPAVATGKFSIAQRVPMRVSSTAQSSSISSKPIVRSSMYAAPRSQSASSNLDRMSCFSRMQTKERLPRSIMEQPGGQKPLFKSNPLLKSYVPDSNLKLGASNLDDELQSQENPVLQQMKKAIHAEASSVLPPPLGSQEVTAGRSTLVTEDAGSSVSPADKCEENKSEVASCTEKRDPMKKAGSASAEFVADLQALASILSNTGVTTGNYGKFSLAQRVPVQGRSASLKGSMTFSGTSVGPAATPKPCLGRLSTTMAVSMKDMASSPFRVPKILMPDKTPSESAKRVHQLNVSARKFSQWYSPWSKQPFFPKTPRALALEMANKKLESELSDTQPSARSKVKWADELSPMTETLRANEPRMEQVAMRLFLDGECSGETDKEKEPAEESSASSKASECLTAGVQKRMEALRPENSNIADVAVPAGVLQDLSVHTNTHPPAALSLTNVTKPSVQYPSISCTKTTLPLSFLSHPAVKALQSSTLGPCSLPDIARLRIQASVSANQRFWETCLDEECAFYTSRRATGSYRNCTDPVSSYLDKQEDLHFNPIIPGEP
ncbi:tastin isoform X1 [Eleutherodactylus coqui]|uniref:tastin isoform X1 n=1 Tax=Eleutherodactylus coqui TaxID=57060 RepID=UPI00346247B3